MLKKFMRWNAALGFYFGTVSLSYIIAHAVEYLVHGGQWTWLGSTLSGVLWMAFVFSFPALEESIQEDAVENYKRIMNSSIKY